MLGKSRITAILALLLLGAITVPAGMAMGKADREDAPKPLQDEHVTRELSPQELRHLLDDHKPWMEAHRGNYKSREAQSDQRRADLTGAILRETDLSGANLTRVNLSNAELSESGLFEGNLTRGDLFRCH
jgi:hypothetical protein